MGGTDIGMEVPGVIAKISNAGEMLRDASRECDLSQPQRVVIVGAGCFGLSTAYHLLARGYKDITVLDRSNILPAPDASSNDINRIVRSSYSDKFYAELAQEAIEAWKDKEFWGDTYRESGVLVLGLENSAVDELEVPGQDKGRNDVASATTKTSSYTEASFLNDLELGCRLLPLLDPTSIRSVFPTGVPTGTFERDRAGSLRRTGYLNRDGGWADAGQGISLLLSEIKQSGAKILAGKTVHEVRQDSGRATGVSCADGTFYDADLIVIATGSWTPSTFSGLGIQRECLATGQCVAMIQLTEEEAAQYKDCPVVLDFASGFYVFPPTAKNILKMAIHGPGFTHTKNQISTPRTIASDPITGLAIPKPVLQEFREHLSEVYPDLARKPFSSTRLCWYNDSPDGDWIISRHPVLRNLIFATAGSGHAYKFLPVIGRLVTGLIEENLEPDLVEKFAIGRIYAQVDSSRSGAIAELDLSQLCSAADLVCQVTSESTKEENNSAG